MTIPEYDQCDCGIRGPHAKCREKSLDHTIIGSVKIMSGCTATRYTNISNLPDGEYQIFILFPVCEERK